MHLGGEECLPNADTATCRVIRLEAVQETAMSFPLAVAIARQQCQHFRDFFRPLICLPDLRLLEARSLQRFWKGHRFSRTVVMHGDCFANSPKARRC